MSDEKGRTDEEVAELLSSYARVVGFQDEVIRSMKRNAHTKECLEAEWEQGFDDGWLAGSEDMRALLHNLIKSKLDASGYGVHPVANIMLNIIKETKPSDPGEDSNWIDESDENEESDK